MTSLAQEHVLIVERRGEVDWLTLNRPQRLNALDKELTEALYAYFEARRHDAVVRVIVIRGAGKGFCAGLDVKALSEPDAQAAPDWMLTEIILAMRACPQPIVALINGAASGGGFSLALAADIRLAAQSARMMAGYVRLGLSGCELGSSYFLPASVGQSVARELLMTGRAIGADRALATGLVSEVAADGELDAAGERLVADLMKASSQGLRVTKETMNAVQFDGQLQRAMMLEMRGQLTCIEGGSVQALFDTFMAPPTSR